MDCPHSKLKEKEFSETLKPSPSQNIHSYGNPQPYSGSSSYGIRPNNPNQNSCQQLAWVDCYRKEND